MTLQEILKAKGWELLPDGKGMKRIEQPDADKEQSDDNNNIQPENS